MLDIIGIKIEHENALKMLDKAGTRVDFAQSIAKIPPELVQTCLDQVPQTAVCGGRTEADDRVLNLTRTFFFAPPTGTETYINPEPP